MLSLLAVVLALAPALAARERTQASSAGSGAECRTLSVTSATQETGRRVFSASQTPNLHITTTFPTTLTGSRRLQLRLLTPQGHLYQRFSIPFDATLPRHDRGAVRSVSATLPVAGTAITTNGLYGRWTIVPSLDDDPAPCTTERHFVLKP
jgi:hypothetical protein